MRSVERSRGTPLPPVFRDHHHEFLAASNRAQEVQWCGGVRARRSGRELPFKHTIATT